MDYISDHLSEPDDFYEIFTWDKLSTKSQNTLQRAIERSDVWRISDLNGFSFDLLSKISIEDLNDARFIGPARANELIQELVAFFKELNLKKEMDFSVNSASRIASLFSQRILSKVRVEEDLYAFLERVASVESLSNEERHKLLQELLPNKNPFTRMVFGRRDREVALGILVDANLRLSFALAKRLCPEHDIRARAIAGNLGLLAGITSFSDKPNIDFESHVMRSIREFIQELIESLNLSYDEISQILFGQKIDTLPVISKAHIVDDEISFKHCNTFAELSSTLERKLLSLPKVDERALAMLKRRHQAFKEYGSSLDEIGKDWGVTRERVRQIVDPLMNVNIHLDYEIPSLVKAIELFETCESEDHFRLMVAEDELFSGEDVAWQRLLGLAEIFSPSFLAKRVYSKHLELESLLESSISIRGSIKKDRSKFGLYDLSVVSKKYEIDSEKLFRIISEIYPRSLRSGNLVLARTKNLDTMFENSIAKQLKVSSPLEISVLIKGLGRTGKNRDTVLSGTISDISNLIFQLAGNPPNYDAMSEKLIRKIEFQKLEDWLINAFMESNLGILHSNDVVNLALRDGGVNVSSVTVYLLNSPIIRSHGKSIFSLVGTEVSKDQLEAYLHIVRGTAEPSEVSYEMSDGSKGILTVRPNLNVITSGIVFPPTGSKRIFEGFEFKSACECGALETVQMVKFAPSGFWTGFTAMIRHGFSVHGFTKSSSFRFEFDFDHSRVQLLLA
jgi:DNA-directed RNA polymerase sigma subunit (sigma70/sigma32)